MPQRIVDWLTTRSRQATRRAAKKRRRRRKIAQLIEWIQLTSIRRIAETKTAASGEIRCIGIMDGRLELERENGLARVEYEQAGLLLP